MEWLDIGGRRVVTSAAMWDGEVALTPDALVVGVGEIPAREQARRDAVRIVQQGMADVLAWLTDPPEPSLPYRTSGEILASLRSGSVTHSTVGSASL